MKKCLVIMFFAFSILLVSCATGDKTVNQINKAELKEEKHERKEKVYESSFNVTVNNIGEPTVPSLKKEYEAIFGKDISVLTLHLLLNEERRKVILQKANVKDISEKELEDFALVETHVNFVFRGKEQLAGIKSFTIEEKSVRIVFSSKNNKASINEIHSKELPETFLEQFSGKGLDDKLDFTEEIKDTVLSKEFVEEFTKALRLNLWLMQTIYISDDE